MEKQSCEILQKITEKLLKDVYYPVTICLWLSGERDILDAIQFDTMHSLPRFAYHSKAAECWLISNHEDGDMRPHCKDKKNRSLAAKSLKGKTCRLFLYSEYEGILEIEDT